MNGTNSYFLLSQRRQ